MKMEMIDKIDDVNKKYNFKLKYFNDTVYVTSKTCEWYFYFNHNDEAILYHKNRKYNKKKYHYQRKFTNIDHMFDRMSKHDKSPVNKKPKRIERIEYLFGII